MRILGIDPGLENTGYGCIEVLNNDIILNEAGVIKTKRNHALEVRLTSIFDNLCEIINEFNPDIVVIEELYSHYKHPKTAIIMGHARGAIILAAGKNSVGVVSYSANRIKKSLTGNGHASKEQVQMMIMSVLNLDSPPSPPDISDALAAALCHANVVNRNTVDPNLSRY
ncbi:crossover junction endodeoxyribonuclease RuvC [candidate division KSB1 bacterium]